MSRNHLADAVWLHNLALQNDYRHIKPLLARPGWYACLADFAYTVAIIAGEIGDNVSVGDRWCYHNTRAAKAALDAWDGDDEPTGWHRHPFTGRRRPEGEASQEYVEP